MSKNKKRMIGEAAQAKPAQAECDKGACGRTAWIPIDVFATISYNECSVTMITERSPLGVTGLAASVIREK